MNQPLIATLQIDEAAQKFYEDLRKRYFPPERNLISAHLTLLHQLPDEDLTYLTLHGAAHAALNFPLLYPTPRSLGRGVAVFFQSEPLLALHSTLALAFQDHLIPQDRQRFQPHIVVQNKVSTELARHTLPQVQATALIEPLATGLTLWRYLSGPWELVHHFPFRDSDDRTLGSAKEDPS